MLVCSLALFCASVFLTVAGSGKNKERDKLSADQGEQKPLNIKEETTRSQPFGVINIPEPKDGAPINIIVYSSVQPTDIGVYNSRAEFLKRRNPPN